MEQDLEQITRPTTSTQFLIFNLFGDYIMPRGGRIWTNDLLYLLDLLDVGERAARSTLSRMKQQGWFESERHGRQSQYILTKRGRAICEQGNRRIFEPPLMDWDGRWYIVVYSLPEEMRRRRNEIRKKLIWFGFGNLAPGTWIAAHDRQTELEPILVELAVERYVDLFSGRHLGVTSEEELIRRCWDLPRLAAAYGVFVKQYQAQCEAFRTALKQGNHGHTAEECFIRRFWLTYDFQTFPRQDPNLPADLLPDDWIGHKAWHVFMDYRRLLTSYMDDFLDNVIQVDADAL